MTKQERHRQKLSGYSPPPLKVYEFGVIEANQESDKALDLMVWEELTVTGRPIPGRTYNLGRLFSPESLPNSMTRQRDRAL